MKNFCLRFTQRGKRVTRMEKAGVRPCCAKMRVAWRKFINPGRELTVRLLFGVARFEFRFQ
jgi:hypothetical protein